MEKKSHKVSEILSWRKGKPPKPSSNYIQKQELPYLSPEFLRGNETAEIVEVSPSSVLVNDDDLILLWDGSNAGEFFKAKKGILSSTMVVFDYSQDINRDFLFYSLKFNEIFLKSQVSGSGIPHVDKEILRNLKIADFEPNKQSKIAAVLSSIDKAIEQTEKLIEKQKRIKRGLLHDLLTKGIDENGVIRSEETHEFKDSPLGRIPKDWEVKSISDIALNIVDCPHTTPKFQPSGVLVARTFNIKDGIYDHKNASFVSEDEYKNRITRLEPKAKDIIFTREAPIGEAFVIPSNLKICLGQRVMLIRLKFTKLLPSFLVEFIYWTKTRIRFEQITGGTTTPHLNVQDVKDFEVLIPSIEEQEKISAILDKHRNQIDVENQKLNKLISIKKGLMQDLLTEKAESRISNLL